MKTLLIVLSLSTILSVRGWPQRYDCGSYTAGKRKGASPLSVQNYPDSEQLYWDALKYEGSGLDDQKGLDSMRLFIQLHPFDQLALNGIVQTGNFISYMSPDDSPVKMVNWKLEYNWLIHAMAWNPDSTYQATVWHELAIVVNWDLNLEANVWWNIYKRFDDTTALWPIYGDPSYPAGQPNGFRFQERAMHPPMDTTPFYLMPIPPDTIPINGAASVAGLHMPQVSLTLAPNPASTTLAINYTLANSGDALLIIYDETGGTVKTIVNSPRGAGNNEITVPIGNLANGHYFVRLSSGRNVVTKELVIQH